MSYKRYYEIRYCWLYVRIDYESDLKEEIRKAGYEIGRQSRGSILGRLSTHRRDRGVLPLVIVRGMGATRRSPWSLSTSVFFFPLYVLTIASSSDIHHREFARLQNPPGSFSSLPLDSDRLLLNLTNNEETRDTTVFFRMGLWFYLVKLKRSNREIKIEIKLFAIFQLSKWIKIEGGFTVKKRKINKNPTFLKKNFKRRITVWSYLKCVLSKISPNPDDHSQQQNQLFLETYYHRTIVFGFQVTRFIFPCHCIFSPLLEVSSRITRKEGKKKDSSEERIIRHNYISWSRGTLRRRSIEEVS